MVRIWNWANVYLLNIINWKGLGFITLVLEEGNKDVKVSIAKSTKTLFHFIEYISFKINNVLKAHLCQCTFWGQKGVKEFVSEWKLLSHVWLFVTPWTVAHQAPPSMEFFSQEYWSRLLCPSPGELPDSGIKPESPTLLADSLLIRLRKQGRGESFGRTTQHVGP